MKMITESSVLADICAQYSEYPYVTVDTEFLRERTYWSQLCVVQLARPGGGKQDAVLIDPLADGIDLSPLFDLMTNPDVIKVFHAARQDVEIFYNMGDLIPAPLFDTQIAAMVCGYGEQVGYETLVRKVAKETIDKSSRFTDWSRRPLSEKQLTYAIADVTHLRDIYEALRDNLEASGRAHWVSEELAILTDPATYRNAPQDAWRRVKSRNSDPAFLAIVRALAAWREQTAQDRDVPRGRILKDDALVEIATAKPRNVDAFSRLRLAQREARKPETTAEIIAAVTEGMNCPEDQRPSNPPPARRREGSGAIADMLKVFLKARADKFGVASRLIASASEIEALSGEDLDTHPVLSGWRWEVFGEDAMRIIQGRAALVVRPKGVELIDVPETALSELADA